MRAAENFSADRQRSVGEGMCWWSIETVGEEVGVGVEVVSICCAGVARAERVNLTGGAQRWLVQFTEDKD